MQKDQILDKKEEEKLLLRDMRIVFKRLDDYYQIQGFDEPIHDVYYEMRDFINGLIDKEKLYKE